MPFSNGLINQNFSQETPLENDYHQNVNPMNFNSFDYKEKQASKGLNSNMRLDYSPEFKLGVKGSSRFFSFDPEDEGLNSYWGVKHHMNQSNFNELNEVLQGQEEDNFMAEENDFCEASDKRENNGLLEKESANRSSRGIYIIFIRICEELIFYKGLRVLSLKVKEIVCEKKETTYKEVAEALVQELNIKDIEMVFNEENYRLMKLFRGKMNKM